MPIWMPLELKFNHALESAEKDDLPQMWGKD